MFRYQNTRKCRASLTCYSLLRPCNRTKSSIPKFARDSAPHEGLPPRTDSLPPRAVTHRPFKERDRRGPPQRGREQRPFSREQRPFSREQRPLSREQRPFSREPPPPPPQRSQWTPRPSPTPTGNTWAPPTTPATSARQQLTIDDFYHPPQSVSVPSNSGRTPTSSEDDELPSEFTSPPLLPALRNSLMEKLGPFAHPTPIQSLSLKYLLQESHNPPDEPNSNWQQFFLASETGSGKSIAYLLPLLQSLKLAELAENGQRRSASNRLYNPRALILAPTHELTRQLSGFAKSLLHELKLRVLCASQANIKSTNERHKTSSEMVPTFDEFVEGVGAFGVSDKGAHGVDVMVGTPMKMLELVRGRGWDKLRHEEKEEENEEDEEATVDEETEKRKPRRGRDFDVGFGRKKTTLLGLQNVEWVIIDEADVLLDSDFQATTRLLLSDISEARGHPVPLTPAPELEGRRLSSPSPNPISYPFNFILTSATIPNSLNNYFQNRHPSLIRLSSPNLHHLPKSLEIEHVSWSGGNKFADIHRRIRQIWSEDAASSPDRTGDLSKVLIFCNKSTKALELSKYLGEQGINCVPMTSESKHRVMGTNRHLFGFLKGPSIVETVSKKKALKSLRRGTLMMSDAALKKEKLVMVTTSLLSRGLDFSPEVKHVFIVDEPRNMVDFLHRAGRSGRAGQRGKVVVFGKLSGRGGERGREVKKRVVSLKAISKPEVGFTVVSSFRKGRPYVRAKPSKKLNPW